MFSEENWRVQSNKEMGEDNLLSNHLGATSAVNLEYFLLVVVYCMLFMFHIPGGPQ